ncbi:MAG: 16S rRNA (uracil(1498)-N(3))-methyltransferase [Gammaproteobacteria bacterium]|nr:16S rRNA (uracil(1498)-N(3))-methyltransferase [Gammaproteobacteria bacterium]
MRLPRLHVAGPLAAGDRELDDEAAHYLLRVLRRRVGDPLIVFDGEGTSAPAELLDAGRRRCVIRLGAPEADHRVESSLSLHLGLALARGERMDLALQKACELGVDRISLLQTERVELKLDARRLENRMRHWQGVLVHAAQQSGRSRIPRLDPPQDPDGFVASLPEGGLRLALDPEGEPLQAAGAAAPEAVVLVTGPEGGLSTGDLEQLDAGGFLRTRLGPRVLRAETAPLAALAVVQWLWGDLGG